MTLLSTRIQALQMVYVDIYQTLKQEFPTKVCIIPKLSRQYNNFASTEDKNNFKWDVKKLRESTDKYRNMLKDKINFANSEQWDGLCEGLLCTMMRDVYAVYMKAAEKKKKKVRPPKEKQKEVKKIVMVVKGGLQRVSRNLGFRSGY